MPAHHSLHNSPEDFHSHPPPDVKMHHYTKRVLFNLIFHRRRGFMEVFRHLKGT